MTKHAFDTMKFGVGQSVTRKEDSRLLRGQGRFTDDINLDGQVHLAMVRSVLAHAVIRSVDITKALEIEGVVGAWSAQDLTQIGPMEAIVKLLGRNGEPTIQPHRTVVARDKVRFVGDIVAFVAAETPEIAHDAAEAVALELDELQVVMDVDAAIEPGAPQLFDNVPNNTVLDFHEGDTDAVTAAFDAAAYRVRIEINDSRVIINPMEPRAALARYDDGHWWIETPTQGVYGIQQELAGILRTDAANITVVSEDVGGSFGMRMCAFPEQVLVMHTARMLGRPVKWNDERTTSFLSDTHGRAQKYTCEMALDAQGRILAVRIAGFGDLGGYLNSFTLGQPTRNIVINSTCLYRVPCIDVSMRAVLTNTVPVGPLRGAGRPEGNYIMERLIEAAARQTGIDKVKLRRLNMLTSDDMPFDTCSGFNIDCGDYPAVMDEALDRADYAGFGERAIASKDSGKLRGIGIGTYSEMTAGSNTEMGGLRFEVDGTVTFITGTFNYGQGHATTFSQILGERLNIPFERINLVQGDSDQLLYGGGSGGSRTVIASGAALLAASDKVVEKALQLAGWALDTDANDIVFSDGEIIVESTGEAITLLELAEKLRFATILPEGLPDSLDVALVNEGPPVTFPNGCHICELEIDPATGLVEIVNYTMVNDIGTVINPALLEAQLHGGVTQGIGQVLLEDTVFDETGQLLSGSLTDYCIPRADDVPNFTIYHHPVPTLTNPLGAKGVGEAGCVGSLSAVMNAVIDALAQANVSDISMPATREKIWRAIRIAS